MKTNKWAIRSLVAAASVLAFGCASAGPVAWTDWTSLATDQKTASGSMGGIGVTVTATSAMNGLSQLQGPGSNCLSPERGSLNYNYWTEPNAADKPYTGGSISNAPTACEQIGLNVANSLTVTFSSAVDTLYMALVSVGQKGTAVTYDFDTSFSIDSEGQGAWGNDPLDGDITAGDKLTMSEFHGVLRFAAPVKTLRFTTAPGENWHAFTFGSVPEPGSLALVGVALLGAGALSRRRQAA